MFRTSATVINANGGLRFQQFNRTGLGSREMIPTCALFHNHYLNNRMHQDAQHSIYRNQSICLPYLLLFVLLTPRIDDWLREFVQRMDNLLELKTILWLGWKDHDKMRDRFVITTISFYLVIKKLKNQQLCNAHQWKIVCKHYRTFISTSSTTKCTFKWLTSVPCTRTCDYRLTVILQ